MDWSPRGNSRLWTGTQTLWEVAVGHPLPADHPDGERRVPFASSPRSIHLVHWYKQHPVTTVQEAPLDTLPKDNTDKQNKIKCHLLCACFLSSCLSFRKLYTDKNGNLLKTGDIVKFEKLADTLEMIANHGADAFYTGTIAENLVRDIQEAGIVRWVPSRSLFQPFSVSAWHNNPVTNEQINWVCKALRPSLTESSELPVSIKRLDYVLFGLAELFVQMFSLRRNTHDAGLGII